MRAAVRAAADLAEPGDIVLLSPACASFDWYDSYAARGDDFRREVRRLDRREASRRREHDASRLPGVACPRRLDRARCAAGRTRQQAERTPNSVLLVLVVAVLNVVGLVMVLSASSVRVARQQGQPVVVLRAPAALDRVRRDRLRRRVAHRLPPLAPVHRSLLVRRVRSAPLVLDPGHRHLGRRLAPLARVGPVPAAAVGDREVRAARLLRRRPHPPPARGRRLAARRCARS